MCIFDFVIEFDWQLIWCPGIAFRRKRARGTQYGVAHCSWCASIIWNLEPYILGTLFRLGRMVLEVVLSRKPLGSLAWVDNSKAEADNSWWVLLFLLTMNLEYTENELY